MVAASFCKAAAATATCALSPPIYSSHVTSPMLLPSQVIAGRSSYNRLLLSSSDCHFLPTLFTSGGDLFSTSATYSSDCNCSMACAFKTISITNIVRQEIKKSRFIAIAGHVFDEQSVKSFLSEVRDPRANHNCWAYKVGAMYHSSDDGEPSGTAGKPIQTVIDTSGIDRVMVVVIRHFGGIKLGANGLVRAYGGLASECLKTATTHIFKTKVQVFFEIPFMYLGIFYHQLKPFKLEDMEKKYDTGEDQTAMITFKVDFDRVDELEEAVKSHCGRDIMFYRR